MFNRNLNAILAIVTISGLVTWNVYLHDQIAALTAKYQALKYEFNSQQIKLTHDLAPLHHADEESLADCLLRQTNARQRYNAVEELVTPGDPDYFGQDIIIKRKDCQRIINRRFNY